MKGFILLQWFYLAALPSVHFNCGKAALVDFQEARSFKNQSGVIHIYVCSRGCYQYVLETVVDGKPLKLSPDKLDDAFKSDNLKVIFDGKLSNETVNINKPAPNDVPVLNFKAAKVLIEAIKRAN